MGCVTKILNPVALEVLINGNEQIYVALCLLPAPGENASTVNVTGELLMIPDKAASITYLCALQLTKKKEILLEKVPLKVLLP